jgi:hypothetical protein
MKHLLLLPAALALSACLLSACISFGPSYSSLKPGSTKADVISAMGGCPATLAAKGGYEARTYTNKMPHIFQWGPANYTFILKDGVLVQFGEGSFQEQTVGGETKYVLVPPATPAKQVSENSGSASKGCAAAG